MGADAAVRAREDLKVAPGAAAQHARLLTARLDLTGILTFVKAPLVNIAGEVDDALETSALGAHANGGGAVDTSLDGVREPIPPIRSPREGEVRTGALSRPLPLRLVGQAHLEAEH